MAETVSTCVQKEVGNLHKELELVRVEMMVSNNKLRKEIKIRLESAGLETRKMFEQIILRFDSFKGEGLKST